MTLPQDLGSNQAAAMKGKLVDRACSRRSVRREGSRQTFVLFGGDGGHDETQIVAHLAIEAH